MLSNKAIFFSTLAGLSGYILTTMSGQRFRDYGVLSGKLGDLQIYAYISIVTKVLGNGSNDNADTLLEEVIRSETNFGYAWDNSPAYGEGLGQFDKIGFNDTIARTSKNSAERLKLIGIDIYSLKYEDLRKNPLASIAMIRLKFLLVPSAIPKDFTERYNYYKKWYNSSLGKATLAGYSKAQTSKNFFA